MKKNIEIVFLILLLFIIFYIFLNTAHPVFKNNDSPEISVAAFTLGIGHPPGYPLFTIAAKVFNFLPLANPAFRTNLFSIFISMVIILLTYFFVKNFVLDNFYREIEKYIIIFSSLFILSFNFLFWNQAIEAKGGIYILNLLFFIILFFSGYKLIKNFSIKNFYLFFYLYGLSLTNHWPSMIIFFPFLFFIFHKNFSKLRIKNYFFVIFFLIAGISPYLFLFIRAKTEPILNWGDPSTPENLLWVIFRKGYIFPVKAGFDVILYQIQEFIKLYISNFNLLWIFSIIGIIELFKKDKIKFLYYIIVFFTIFLAVVFYNRTPKDLLWQMDIFLLPAMYIIYIGIITGFNAVLKFNHNKLYRTSIFIILFFLIFIMFKSNLNKNNNSRDYLLYDYGKNILNTMDNNACYIGDGDYNLMPVYYLQNLQKIRNDIKFVTVSFLIFKWGINDFIKKYNYVSMKPFDTNNNIKNIIEYYNGKNEIYLSSYFPRLKEINLRLITNQKGLLLNLSNKKRNFSSKIFDIYSYRGIYEKFCILNKMNKDLIGWYPACMVNQANEIMAAGNYDDAIKLYKKSLLFPIDKPEDNIYYNLSLAYKAKNDILNQLKCLLNASEKTKEQLILEETILLCYYTGFLAHIEHLLKKLPDNTRNENIVKIKEILSKLNQNEKYEIMLIKANEFINANNYDLARFLYEKLIEFNYKTGIIYRNLGVYYFKTEEYGKAIEYFKRSQNETQNAEIYLYIAYTQYKMDDKSGALNTLRQGLEIFKEDKQLRNLFNNIQKEVLKSEKNFNNNEK